MELDLNLLTAFGRSNIQKYDSTKIGVVGTIYIDYDENVGYLWNSFIKDYDIIFNKDYIKGLVFQGIYDVATGLPDLNTVSKAIGDFWISTVGNWLIWNGTTFNEIDSSLVDNGTIRVSATKYLSILNGIYLADSSNGNITLTIPYATTDNKNEYVKVIKVSTDNNIVKVVCDRAGREFDLTSQSDYIGFVSSGSVDLDWIVDEDRRKSEPVKYIELVGSDVLSSRAENNWRLIPNGSDLFLQRYFNDQPATIMTIGNGVTAYKYTLKNTSGRVSFHNTQGQTKTMISPSKDSSGIIVGNPEGRISLVNNGGLYDVNFDQTELTSVVNASISESMLGNKFSYNLISDKTQAIKSGTINLKYVPMGTRFRFVAQDLNGNILEESIGEFDFESNVIKGGQVVIAGSNTINLLEDLVLPPKYEFMLTFYFSTNVTITGATINLNDGLGLRFLPTFSYNYLSGNPHTVVNDNNIKSIIDSLVNTDRIDSYAVYNGIYISSADLILNKNHINHTIVFDHTTGTVKCKIDTTGIFNQGDKLTLYSKYATTKFIDIDTVDVIEIKRDEVLDIQKSQDGSWHILNKFLGEGYGEKLYYFTDSTNSLTIQNIKSNILNYDYIIDWNMGQNTFNFNVDTIGNYYVYFIIPTCFGITGYNYSGNIILNGTSYDIFISKAIEIFTSLSKSIIMNITTDALAYTDIPNNREILIGDGTQTGIKGSGVLIDNVNKKYGIIAKNILASQPLMSTTDTILLFDTDDTNMTYDGSSCGLSYADGIFTNTSGTIIVLSISYQIGDNSKVKTYIKTNSYQYYTNSINITLLINGTFEIHGLSSEDTTVNNSVQIVRLI